MKILSKLVITEADKYLIKNIREDDVFLDVLKKKNNFKPEWAEEYRNTYAQA